jgi:hypothetical protein
MVLERRPGLFCCMDPVAWGLSKHPTHEITTLRPLKLYLGISGFNFQLRLWGNIAALVGERDDVNVKQSFRLNEERLMAALPGLDGWISSIEDKQWLEVCLFDSNSYTATFYRPPQRWIINLSAPLLNDSMITLCHDSAADWAARSPVEFKFVLQLLEPYQYDRLLPESLLNTVSAIYGEEAAAAVKIQSRRDTDHDRECLLYEEKIDKLRKQLNAANLNAAALWRRLDRRKKHCQNTTPNPPN